MTECVRQKGLGKFMMQLLELIGHKANMRKVVLTVFKGKLILLFLCVVFYYKFSSLVNLFFFFAVYFFCAENIASNRFFRHKLQ